MTETTVGAYLATRLAQLGAHHLFGLPGDYNLNLLDEMLTVDGIRWTGTANELNAAYAADGYARTGRRPAALVTTYGVGELSALNGIAGSYAEDVPVVHIAGMPSRAAIQAGAPIHHTFLDGDFGRFQRMSREVTAAQAILEPHTAADEIDRVLRVALDTSKPVYLGVPLDVARAAVPADALRQPLRSSESEPTAVEEFRAALEARLGRETGICLLAGHRVHRRGLEPVVAGLAALPGVRLATQPGAKAMLDEDHPASLGTYTGATTQSPSTRDAVDQASALVMVGTVQSDFTTGFFTHRYDPATAVELAIDHARIGRAIYPGVRLEDSLPVLAELVERHAFPDAEAVTPAGAVAAPAGELDDPLDHAGLWAELQAWIPPATTVVAEAGTAYYGALDLRLSPESDLLGQPVWGSIGYTLPATLGAALAQPNRRPVLIIGDGSAQLTIQELGTIDAHGIRPVILLLNNNGYTVERLIQSPEAAYQDITPWDWTRIPAALGAPKVETSTVHTPRELRSALENAADPHRAAFIEVVLPPLNAPRLLAEIARGLGEANAAAGRG
ncbi:alpha-keto acid decarboxylase family protein [Pseudonocardia eucalypti]|uniref:Alpha-keto-acid decarboxylase n=1 Tax=Pseudonocardia eucalypti TaxID=648755 RepID=A0ABP9RGC8_9PSEU|nr:indolepyruvate decarboxylase [Pseudonocardia eucalypti]